MKTYTYEDKEVNIKMEYELCKPLEGVHRSNCFVKVVAQGDFPHHVIEGIVEALKVIQENNSHLKEALREKTELKNLIMKCKCGLQDLIRATDS